MYDERFKGYGSNKIQQAFEMCLNDFEFHVLDNAFLVHEGIHHLPKTEIQERGAIIKANYRLLMDFSAEISAKFTGNPVLADCKLDKRGDIIGYFPNEQKYHLPQN